MRPVQLVGLVTLALALAFGSVTAVARPAKPAPSPSPIERSRKLYETATEQYRLGKFEDALAGYEAAYELFKAPQFLFNIAQCHFQLQRWDRAIFFFEGYLRDLPDAGNRALVDELIAEARQRRAAQVEAERRRLELERERLDIERIATEREVAERTRRSLSMRPVEAPPERPLYKKWWFWSLVGGAAAGIAVTAVVTGGDSSTVLPAGSLGTWDRR